MVSKILRDETHNDQIVRWANHVKSSYTWKAELNEFIDAQFEIASRFYSELAKTTSGREKLKKIRESKISGVKI